MTIKLIGSGFLRWLQEFVINVYVLYSSKPALIIAVDPLNFVAAYTAAILNKPGKTIVIFHSIDFSEARFRNVLLNRIYLLLYKFAITKADKVTYVSTRMGEKIISLIGKGGDTRLFFLPNSPETNTIKRIDPEKKSKNTVVYSKAFISDSEINLLIQIADKLQKDEVPVVLRLIGHVTGEAVARVQSRQCGSMFKFYGLLSYEDNIGVVSDSGIGFAWYEGSKSFEKYADSLKIREYACAGLPGVSNDVVSTCVEMQKEGAGIIVRNQEEGAAAIKQLLTDDSLYNQLRENSINWACRLDKKIMLEKLFITESYW